MEGTRRHAVKTMPATSHGISSPDFDVRRLPRPTLPPPKMVQDDQKTDPSMAADAR
jgi:hypothetical protein